MGNVTLGGGTNRFTNRAGATFYSGATLDLGAASNLFTNDGTLVPGAGQLAQTTRISGSYRQTAASVSNFELDFKTGAVDSLVATGNMDLAGSANVTLLNTQVIKSGHHELPLYSAGGTLTNNGLVLAGQPSIVIQYGLSKPDSRIVALSYDVDFSPEGAVGNRISIGDYINRMQDAGSASLMADTIRRARGADAAGSLLDTAHAAWPGVLRRAAGAHGGSSIQQFTRVMQNCGEFDVSSASDDDTGCTWARFDY